MLYKYKTLKILLLALLLPLTVFAQKIDVFIPGFIDEENNKTDFKVKELAITRFPMCDSVYKNPYIVATYTYNEHGYLIKEIKNNREGNEVSRIHIAYDSLNSYAHITQIKSFYYTIELNKFKYDKLGRLRKVTGLVNMTVIKNPILIAYFYHKKTKECTVSIRINSGPASKVVVEYNNNNNVVVIKKNKKITQSAIFDPEERLMETRYYDGSFTTSTFYTHDNYKLITESQSYINGVHCFRSRFAYFFYNRKQ